MNVSVPVSLAVRLSSGNIQDLSVSKHVGSAQREGVKWLVSEALGHGQQCH